MELTIEQRGMGTTEKSTTGVKNFIYLCSVRRHPDHWDRHMTIPHGRATKKDFREAIKIEIQKWNDRKEREARPVKNFSFSDLFKPQSK